MWSFRFLCRIKYAAVQCPLIVSIISYFSSLTIRFSNAYVFLYYFNELHSVVLCTILMNYIVLHAWNYSEVCSVLFCQSTLMSNKKQTWTWSLDWTLRVGGYYIRKNTLTIRSMSFSGERQKNLFFFFFFNRERGVSKTETTCGEVRWRWSAEE